MRRHVAPLIATIAVAAAIGLAGLPTTGPAPAALAAEPAVHFTAAGDYSTGSNVQAVLGKIASLAPDLHLALGDLSYGAAGAEQAWCNLVTQIVGAGFPFELISGNHESDGTNGNINDFSACLPNQLPGVVGTYGRQWYVDVPAQNPLVRFVLISPGLTFPDGTYTYTAGSARYAWTAAAIDGARAASIPWVVVGMHKPCLSDGIYACESGADLQNLMLSKKVDLVLSGHEHLYQRTKQLALAPGCTAMVPNVMDADCVADSDPDLVKGAGTVFATVGTGGIAQRPLTPADPEAPYFAAASGLDTATWGVLNVQATATTLTASFARASGGSFADAFTIRPAGPAQNVPPTAAFTATCTLLTCAFDGSGSTDPEGAISSYAWDYGDGAAGTGTTSSHLYVAGTYTVTLTVTDGDSATATRTRSVTVPAAATGYLAKDAFERAVATGFGSADLGGPWSVSGTTSVASGGGRLTLATKSSASGGRLAGVTGTALVTRATESWDKRPNSSGGWFLLRGRITTGGEYRLKLGHKSTGAVTARLMRTNTAGTETAITAEVTVPGLTYAAGTGTVALVDVSGTAPTALRAKVWAATGTQPAAWLIDTTDATAALQGPGHTGVAALLSSSTTNGPVTVRLDDYSVLGPGGSPAP